MIHKVGVDGRQDLVHGQVLLVEDMRLERRQAVGAAPRCRDLNVRRVVPGSTVVVVTPPRNAVLHEERQERCRHLLGIQPLDDVVATHLDVHEVMQLRFECFKQLAIASKCSWITRVQTDDLAGTWVQTVMQGHFENLGQVQVAGENVRFTAERTGFDTAGNAAHASIDDRLALAEEFLNDHVGIEDRGLTPAFADDLSGTPEEAVRTLAAELDVRGRLEQVHVVDDVEQEITEVVHTVRAIGAQSTHIDIGKSVYVPLSAAVTPTFGGAG